MKRFVSLALAAALTLSIAPVSALAQTENSITKVVSVSRDQILNADNAPIIVIDNSLGHITDATTELEFALELEGAEWALDSKEETGKYDLGLSKDGSTFYRPNTDPTTEYTVSKGSGQKLYVTIKGTDLIPTTPSDQLRIRLSGVKITGDTAKVKINGENSQLSTTTHTFAKSAEGGAIITLDGKKDFSDGASVNDIIIEEITNDSLKGSSSGLIKIRLNSGFKFNGLPKIEVIKGAGTKSVVEGRWLDDGRRDIAFDITADLLDDQTISILKITGMKISESGAKYGDSAEITVSGENIGDLGKTTLEMGKYIDYNVSVSTEDKDLPAIYSGMSYSNDENRTLKLTVKEGVEDSWFTDRRKTTFTFPEGVKVKNINVETKDTENFRDENNLKFTYDGNVVTLPSADKISGKKAKLVVTFDLWVAPDFTGDITCEVGGPAVSRNEKVTIAKAVAPLTVEAVKTPVSIDYRNVAVGDITITEPKAGLWSRNKQIILNVENMRFEQGIKAEVVEGDGVIKRLDIKGNNLIVEVDTESSKTPMKVRLSNISLFLDRTLPVGDYALKSVLFDSNPSKTIMFQTYNRNDGNDPNHFADKDQKEPTFGFDINEVKMLNDYVTVTTAGRDQSTAFTTEINVTIDSTTMKVDGKDVTLEVPAYLSAEGYTMLPIRAVGDAFAVSSNTKVVDWIDGNPGTILLRYGDKTVSMTLGSTTMYINGTPVPMTTSPVIVNNRAFLPLRDLGRALGLTENEIRWDAATRTATLNPKTPAAKTDSAN